MKRKISIDELRFGQYVCELDRPWTDTPFVFQGFLLARDQQLEALRKYCKFVWVDTERSESDDQPARRGSLADYSGLGIRKYAEMASVETELPRAGDAYVSTQQALTSAFSVLRHEEQVLDPGELKAAVGRITESMVRNPDALLLFASLRERGEAFSARALKVSLYMSMLARFLGLDQPMIERSGLVGLLLDVGMLSIPQAVLAKSGALSGAELALVREHPERGANRVRQISGFGDEIALPIALHHERFNGSGYPKSLRDKQIGLLGAMAGIVDTFCAMTSPRSYAETLSPSNVLGMMHRWRDRMFNGALIEQFVRCIGIFPVGSVVLLNSGETGIIIAQNLAKRLQPRVMVVKDAAGNPLRPHKLLDLAREPKASPDTPYRIRHTLESDKAGVGLKDISL